MRLPNTSTRSIRFLPTGGWRDAIGRIYFIDRKGCNLTIVTATCVGLVGTVITLGAMAKATDGTIYLCTQAGDDPGRRIDQSDVYCSENRPDRLSGRIAQPDLQGDPRLGHDHQCGGRHARARCRARGRTSNTGARIRLRSTGKTRFSRSTRCVQPGQRAGCLRDRRTTPARQLPSRWRRHSCREFAVCRGRGWRRGGHRSGHLEP